MVEKSGGELAARLLLFCKRKASAQEVAVNQSMSVSKLKVEHELPDVEFARVSAREQWDAAAAPSASCQPNSGYGC